MTIKALFPSSEPALELDFANTKALDPRVTFTRVMTGASVATFVGADGLIKTAGNRVPRFDHNPTTGESLGLLVEEARTNLMTYSEQFDDAAWVKTALTVTANQAVAPDGTNTADLLSTSTTGFNVYWIRQDAGSTPSTSSSTIYVKYISQRYVKLRYGGSTFHALFDLVTGTKIAESGGITGSITLLGNGWFRISATTLSANNRFDFRFSDASGADSPDIGASATSVYIWGAQLEAGSFATSYIPTTAATATRAADVATVSNTGSSIFPTSAFTTVNSPFGTAGGGSTVKLVGPTIKRTAIYAGDLPQVQINALTNTGDFWRWRVVGSTFALPNFTTNGSVTVDWGDGTVQTLTTGVYTFTNGGGYHDIGFRLNSGTFFRPAINNNGTYAPRVIAVGPAPASMRIDANQGFMGCGALRAFDSTVDVTGGTDFTNAWQNCSSLTSFPLINTAGVTNFSFTWFNCSSLTSFPLINTGSVTNFRSAWQGCPGLTSFPLINSAAGTNFEAAWFGCSSLTSFPLINTAAATYFYQTWGNCTGLTSFPQINTGSVTNFFQTWVNCTSLTSFPLINTGAGTNFQQTWGNCTSLTSFPLINTGAGTSFYASWNGCNKLTSFPALNFSSATTFYTAWYNCSMLATFPANVFNTTGTLVSNAFHFAFDTCALTAASIENILTSLVINGQSNITLSLNAGTSAGASTWTANAIAAYNTLISRGWTIIRNA